VQPEVVALGAADKAASKHSGAGADKKATDEARSLQAFARSYKDITSAMG